MKINTKRLIIRDFKLGDEISTRENVNNLNVSKWLLVVPYPYKKPDALWWINECIKNQKKKPRESFEFAITLKKNKQEVIGGVGLSKVNLYEGTAELGYWLGENYWKCGYGYEAAKKVLEFAFKKLKLRRMNVSAFKKNKGSNALIKKLGFKFEGMRKKFHKTKATGEIVDANFYGMFKEDWKKK